jgi:anti-sigma factor RsiW
MTTCPLEHAIVDRLLREGAADGEDPDLGRHLSGCPHCAEIAAVVRAVRADHAAACRDAAVPSAGLVWWRASIRARAEAARTAEQPISVAQAVAGAAIAAAGGALGAFLWHAVPTWPQTSPLELIAIGGAVCCVVAPLAVVLTLVARNDALESAGKR